MSLVIQDTEKVALNPAQNRGISDIYSRATPDNSVVELGNALSKLGGQFTSLASGQTEAKEAADARNLEFYIGKARQEIVSGLPTQVQLGNILPEQSNVIRGRVAESLGFEQGQQWAQERYAALMSDENLVNNPQAFNTAITTLRTEAYQKAKADPAYGAGYMRAVDGMANQASANATQQRTRMMTEAQERQYHRDNVDDLGRTDDPGPVPHSAKPVSEAPGPVKKSVVSYDNKGATRHYPITQTLTNKLDDAVQRVYGEGYRAVVYSGGQDDDGRRKLNSSHRHDHGKAGDIYIYGPDGKQVKGDELGRIAQYWLGRKYGGVGLEMKGGGIHLDEHTDQHPNWNYAAKGGQYTSNQRKAVEAGLRGELPALAGTANNTQVAANTVPTGPVAGIGSTTDASVAPGAAQPNNAPQVEPKVAQVQPPVPPEIEAARNRARHRDAEYARSSSLTRDVRRNSFINTAIQEAQNRLDTSYLDRIPPEFIGSEHESRIVAERRKIEAARVSVMSAQRQAREEARKEAVRQGKNAINQAFIGGSPMNPASFTDDPELFEYAIKRQQDEIHVDPSWSHTNMNTAETRIEKAALTNNWAELGFDKDIPPSREEMDNWVDDLADMRAADRAKLKEKIPELMELGVFVGGKQSEEWYDRYLGKSVNMMQSSPLSSSPISAKDYRSTAKDTYDTSLRMGFKAYIEDHGKPPSGQAAMDIYRQAVEDAREAMDRLYNYKDPEKKTVLPRVDPTPSGKTKASSSAHPPATQSKTRKSPPAQPSSPSGKSTIMKVTPDGKVNGLNNDKQGSPNE